MTALTADIAPDQVALPPARSSTNPSVRGLHRPTFFRAPSAGRPWADRSWPERAACKGMPDPDVMYPDDKDRKGIRRAKAICAQCPVMDACLTYALDHDMPFGIWGGLTDDERRRCQGRRPRREASASRSRRTAREPGSAGDAASDASGGTNDAAATSGSSLSESLR